MSHQLIKPGSTLSVLGLSYKDKSSAKNTSGRGGGVQENWGMSQEIEKRHEFFKQELIRIKKEIGNAEEEKDLDRCRKLIVSYRQVVKDFAEFSKRSVT